MDEPQPTGIQNRSPDRSLAHLRHHSSWRKFCLPVLIFVSANFAAGCLPLGQTPDQSIQATTSALAVNPAEAVRTLEALPPILLDRAVGMIFETSDPATRTVNANAGSGIVWLETKDKLVILTAGHVFPENQFDDVTVSQPQKKALGGFLKTRTIEADRVQLFTQDGNPLGLAVIQKTIMPDPEMNNLTKSNGNPPPLDIGFDWGEQTVTTLGFPAAVDSANPWFATTCFSGSDTPVNDDEGNPVFALACNAVPGASGEPLITGNGKLAGLLQSGSRSGIVQAVPVVGEFFNRYLAPLLQQAGLNFSPN